MEANNQTAEEALASEELAAASNVTANSTEAKVEEKEPTEFDIVQPEP